MTLIELRDLLNSYLDQCPEAALRPVRFREIGFDSAQEPVEGEIATETEGDYDYVVLATTEP